MDQKISYMNDLEALPRKSGELVFHDDWEKRIFALVVALYEKGHFEWDEFKDLLIEQIRSSGETPEKPNLDKPGYYEFWLTNLEVILDRRNEQLKHRYKGRYYERQNT